MASGVIEFADVDFGDTHTVSAIPDGQNYLGTFSAHLNNDATGGNVGHVTWTFSSGAAALQFLAEGQQLTQTYTVIIADGHGGTATQLVTVTISGTNDAAVISGDITGTVTEAGGVNNGMLGVPIVTGDLNSTDVDNPGDGWQAVAAGAATYGTYRLTAAGVWIYTLNNSNAAVQALNVGDPPLTDSFTALTVDGTAQLVTITINGANDAAVISGTTSGNVIEAGGVANGTPGVPTATGDLNSTDVDNPPNDSWQAVAAGAATLRQLRAVSDRGLDLHARRQQSDGAGAQRHRHADRQLHGADRRRHRAARHHHHHGAERRGGDQRHHIGQRDGSRRHCQRHAGHAHRHRRSQLHRRRQSGRQPGRW